MKNFNQMSSKKLNALLSDPATTEEEKNAINEVLAKRVKAAAEPSNETSDLSPEEQAAIAAAEEANGSKPVEKQPKVVKPGLTDEERKELAEKLRAGFLYHKCEVVPFNSIEWIPGVVAGIIEDAKRNKVMIAIKTDDGRRIVKAHDSKLYRVLDEVVESPKRGSKPKLDENGNPITFTPWTSEEIEAEFQKFLPNVGKTVQFAKSGAFGKATESEEAEIFTGRIMGLVPEKRNKTILYRILVDQEDPEAEAKYMHKVTGSGNIEIADEFDEKGFELNAKYAENHTNRINGVTTHRKAAPAKNPAEYYASITTSLEAAKSKAAKLAERIKSLEATLVEAKEAYEKYVAEGGEPLAEDSGEDLM